MSKRIHSNNAEKRLNFWGILLVLSTCAAIPVCSAILDTTQVGEESIETSLYRSISYYNNVEMRLNKLKARDADAISDILFYYDDESIANRSNTSIPQHIIKNIPEPQKTNMSKEAQVRHDAVIANFSQQLSNAYHVSDNYSKRQRISQLLKKYNFLVQEYRYIDMADAIHTLMFQNDKFVLLTFADWVLSNNYRLSIYSKINPVFNLGKSYFNVIYTAGDIDSARKALKQETSDFMKNKSNFYLTNPHVAIPLTDYKIDVRLITTLFPVYYLMVFMLFCIYSDYVSTKINSVESYLRVLPFVAYRRDRSTGDRPLSFVIGGLLYHLITIMPLFALIPLMLAQGYSKGLNSDFLIYHQTIEPAITSPSILTFIALIICVYMSNRILSIKRAKISRIFIRLLSGFSVLLCVFLQAKHSPLFLPIDGLLLSNIAICAIAILSMRNKSSFVITFITFIISTFNFYMYYKGYIPWITPMRF